ncbi:phosphotransferase family protein [Novosphingobium beihaiensis]|uniref:Ecdysteroid 22-kinase family protein n=1 Tax=Novosphingobium beihaiensis TaxID=2930389 RepID=A0ABT0BML1_9SPHN|nr:ecdysteroid 22-kinase family protein [Novosphingobium beihaiensis]MCJ2186290.1 ecdysteroid 22-kinase family protein [Novosphingobium beihaiensis]
MPGISPFPLPVKVEDVTAAWLTAALRTRTPGVTIRACEVVDTVFSTCSKIRLQLKRDETAIAAGIPERIIVKGGFEEHGRLYHQMHEREVRGYRDVYPHVPLPHPACYFAEYDDEEKQGIIVMEDLVTKDVAFCHATRPHTHEQVARRLEYLARFHAATWASPELAPGERWGALPEFFPVMQHFFDEKSSPENWARFMAAPRGAATPQQFQDREWLVSAWPRMLAYAADLPHCVLHGDIHLGNLYIEPDGTPGFLDTLASRGPGMLEVAYHISGSIDVADRPRWEGALVRHYLDELARAGAPAPGFDEAMHQYAVFQLYGYFIWASTESHYQAEAVNTVNAVRSAMAMLDHDTAGCIARL